ncbi:ABC transporter substrate-binding protein [Pigmentiphaga soli]|uniref:ABC transporter substrate-binding protein n=2 Tax=Pigmentiphaga soli TaxID=1007095 RepID=A0ABP8HPY8_9BURK
MASHPIRLRTLLGDYPNTRALRNGELESPLAAFDFADVKVANRAFKKVVREHAFDVAELALVTFLQARAYGKPLVLLPAVVGAGRFQHHCLVHDATRGKLGVAGLAGKRIGIRAYAQTTVTWVRGVLADDYGVDLDAIEWVTFEDGHLAEFPDPAGTRRAPAGATMAQMLFAGELDAAIIGTELPDDPRLQPVLPDPFAAARAWSERHGMLPINHMVALDAGLCRDRPDVVRDIYRLLQESKRRAGAPADGVDMTPFGVEANRRALALLIRYAHEQRLIPRRYEVDELFDDTTRMP